MTSRVTRSAPTMIGLLNGLQRAIELMEKAGICPRCGKTLVKHCGCNLEKGSPMTRTLKDYRPQHDNDCASGVTDYMGYYPHDPPVACSCGLDHLLAEFDAPGAQERTTEDQDHGAGLIHQAIPDMAGTEPRLNKSEK